ncbi:FxLYD domain-containing protein [Streptomyces sp. NPDC090085]|uniref:FxLYD domain-containing protein n=1 Tax=Streptomyces sp. NPDC090085 TaxID=3365943 RepID=UPI0037F6EFCE
MSSQEPPPGWGQRSPSGGYPQQWGPPPPRKGSAGKIIGFSCLGAIVMVVVLVIVGLLVGGRGDGRPERRPPSVPASQSAVPSGQPREESGPRGDVKITACEVDSFTKWPHAKLLVTNRSSKASNYTVQVEFVDAGGKRLSEAFAVTNGVAPGQQSAVTAQSLDQVTAKVTCRITEVDRYAS